MIDVLGPEKRRRRTTQEKIAIVQQSFEPKNSSACSAKKRWKMNSLKKPLNMGVQKSG